MKTLDVLKAGQKAFMGVVGLVGVVFFASGFRFISTEDAAVRFVIGGVMAAGSAIFLWNRRRARYVNS